jgi:hypothetical protein
VYPAGPDPRIRRRQCLISLMYNDSGFYADDAR